MTCLVIRNSTRAGRLPCPASPPTSPGANAGVTGNVTDGGQLPRETTLAPGVRGRPGLSAKHGRVVLTALAWRLSQRRHPHREQPRRHPDPRSTPNGAAARDESPYLAAGPYCQGTGHSLSRS